MYERWISKILKLLIYHNHLILILWAKSEIQSDWRLKLSFVTTTIILDLVLQQVSQCISTLFFWLSINMMCAHFLVPCHLFTLLQRENEARNDETGLVSINSQNNINIQKRKSHREWNRCIHIIRYYYIVKGR